MKQFATDHPVAFALTLVAALLAAQIASVGIGESMGGSESGRQVGQALGRIVLACLFLALLWKFGWLASAGFNNSAGKGWLVVFPLLAYTCAVYLYSFFGEVTLDLSARGLAALVAFNQLSVGLLEETVFRGVILYTFIRLWGNSTAGLAKSVAFSSCLFGAAHALNLLAGKPILDTLLQIVGACFSGFYLGAFVLRWRSIWPAIVFHGVGNAVVNINLIGRADFHETLSANISILLLKLPLVIYGVYLVRRVPPRPPVPNAP